MLFSRFYFVELRLLPFTNLRVSFGVFHLPYIKGCYVELSTAAAAAYCRKKIPPFTIFPICSSCGGVPLKSINQKTVAMASLYAVLNFHREQEKYMHADRLSITIKNLNICDPRICFRLSSLRLIFTLFQFLSPASSSAINMRDEFFVIFFLLTLPELLALWHQFKKIISRSLLHVVST